MYFLDLIDNFEIKSRLKTRPSLLNVRFFTEKAQQAFIISCRNGPVISYHIDLARSVGIYDQRGAASFLNLFFRILFFSTRKTKQTLPCYYFVWLKKPSGLRHGLRHA